MRTAYLLNSKYLPTLEFMLRYYQSKVETSPELQTQVTKFEREIAFVKAQTDRSADDDTATNDLGPTPSNDPILPPQKQPEDNAPTPSTN